VLLNFFWFYHHFRFVHIGLDPEDIGIIAPYKAQSRAIRELLKVAKLSDISVGSVEEFQGQVLS
jgi:superfamily I DNA and/or RNA helicase